MILLRTFLRLPAPRHATPAAPVDRPAGLGWYWWRPDHTNPWVALQVCNDRTKGELFVRTVEDDLYQCDGDPDHEWFGEWWPMPLSPPPR